MADFVTRQNGTAGIGPGRSIPILQRKVTDQVSKFACNVGRRDDQKRAVRRVGFRQIDRTDGRVRMRGTQDNGERFIGKAKVVDISSAPGENIRFRIRTDRSHVDWHEGIMQSAFFLAQLFIDLAPSLQTNLTNHIATCRRVTMTSGTTGIMVHVHD